MEDLQNLAMAEENHVGAKKPIIMPDIYKGDIDEEWEDWLEHFNACAEINCWDEATKCRFMGVRLKNNAYKFYKELEAAVKTNCTDLSETLEKRFKTVSQMQYYKTKFQGVAQTAGESLLDLGNKIRTLSRKAYPNLEAKLRDELARDQFVRSLTDVEMTLKLRHQIPGTLDDAIRIAIDWQTVEQDVRKAKDLKIEKEKSSEACCASMQPQDSSLHSMMKELLTFMKEDREESRKYRVTSNQSRERRPDNDFRCYTCGSDRHLRRNCPRNKPLLCWNCNFPGHTRANCPNVKQSSLGNGN